MSFTLIVNFDKNTIPEQLMSEIITNNTNLIKTAEDQYIFNFELLDFQHALIELIPFPPNEAHVKIYLEFTHVILKDLNSLSEYSEKFCLTDHKRMTMEPLGVSFSSLFMVRSFGIKWQHIAHLPQEFLPDGKQQKRGDFIAYRDNSRYYYEAKGTTRIDKVNSFMKEALTQVKQIPFDSESKFAFVTLIPGEEFIGSPKMYIADPPSDWIFNLDKDLVTRLHYRNVLLYANFVKTYSIYMQILRVLLEKTQYEQTKEKIVDYDKISDEITLLLSEIVVVFEAEFTSLDKKKIRNYEFVGRSFEISHTNEKLVYFQGIEKNIIKSVINFSMSIPEIKNEMIIDQGESSIFSDGTILHMHTESFDKSPIKSSPNKNEMEKIANEKTQSKTASNQYNYNRYRNTIEEKVPIVIRR